MIRYYLLGLLFWISGTTLMAASADRPTMPVAALTAPTSLTSKVVVVASSIINVPTIADYRNGVTITQNSLQLTGTANSTYTLAIRASSANFVSGVNTIPVNLIGITVLTAMIGATTKKRLTTALQTIATNRPTAAFTNFVVNLQYKLYSDPALLKPAGLYTTTLTFSLTGIGACFVFECWGFRA